MAGYDLSGCGAGQCEIAVAGLPGWPPGRCDSSTCLLCIGSAIRVNSSGRNSRTLQDHL